MTLSTVLAIASFLLEAELVIRAIKGGFLIRFRLFYSYLVFVFIWTAVTWTTSFFRPESYASLYWSYFTIMLLVEFAVLIEISDHVFKPYPAVRQLGRFISIFVAAIFFSLYILSSPGRPKTSSEAILDLAKRASLAKAVIITALLLAAHYYRLPLGKNISGMMLGFALYLSICVANFAAAGQFGEDIYAKLFRFLLPLSYTLCLSVWTVALWRYEPVLPIRRNLHGNDTVSEPLDHQLERFNTALMRLLRR